MIPSLIERARGRADCVVLPPSGQPVVSPPHVLAPDVSTFYACCGGIQFFRGHPYEVSILPPAEITLANDRVLGFLSPEQRAACADDRSWAWYAIGRDGNGDYLSIDADPARSGRCYDSFWDCHGLPGDCPVIARTFSELVSLLLNQRIAEQPYWLDPAFLPFGDAYD